MADLRLPRFPDGGSIAAGANRRHPGKPLINPLDLLIDPI
jgi:hypothetical protein